MICELCLQYVFQDDSSATDLSSIASSSKTIVSIPKSSPHQRQQNINEVFKQISSMAGKVNFESLTLKLV